MERFFMNILLPRICINKQLKFLLLLSLNAQQAVVASDEADVLFKRKIPIL